MTPPIAALLAIVVAGASACTGGYPSDDEPLLDPSAMTQAQRVDKLNQLGDRAHLDRRWRYRLLPGCELQVSTAKAFGSQRSLELPLPGASFRAVVDGADKTYHVRMAVAGTSAQEGVSVLAGGRWADAVLVESLLQNMARDCARSGAAV